MEIKELTLPPNQKKIIYEIGRNGKTKVYTPSGSQKIPVADKDEKVQIKSKWIDCRIQLGLLNSIQLTKDNKFKNTLKENPFSQKQGNSVSNPSSNTQQITCNCSKTKCIKLYCMCFANGLYCRPQCSCKGCSNNVHNSKKLTDLREMINDRKATEKLKGCKCMKSNCTKKYCECFGNGQACNQMCQCSDCHNKVTTSVRKTLGRSFNTSKDNEVEELKKSTKKLKFKE